MTVETDLDRAQYATNATTGPWTVPFYFLAVEELSVTYTDAGGNNTSLVLNVDYSVVGAGDEDGGTITTTQAYAAGGKLVILRAVSFVQPVEYQDGDAFPAKTHERALDRLTMMAQQLREKIGRCLGFSDSESVDGELPPAALRANNLLGFDSNGKPIAVAPVAGTATALATQLSSSAGSSGVGFIGAKPGMSARTSQSKMRDIISLADYPGFDPTGATETSTVINLATQSGAAFSSALAYDIYVPDGTFLHQGTSYIRSGQTLRGAGKGTYFVCTGTASNTPNFVCGSGSGGADGSGSPVEIRDFRTIGGGGAAGVIKSLQAGLTIADVFMTSPGIGLDIQGADTLIYGVEIDQGLTGMLLSGANHVITNCGFYLLNYAIQLVSGLHDVAISDSKFEYSQYAGILYPTGAAAIRAITVSGCNFTMNAQFSTFLGYIAMQAGTSEVFASGCSFRNMYNWAINHNGGIGNTMLFSGCVFDGAPTTPGYTSSTTAKVLNTVASGASIYDFQGCEFRNLLGEIATLTNGITNLTINGGMVINCDANAASQKRFNTTSLTDWPRITVKGVKGFPYWTNTGAVQSIVLPYWGPSTIWKVAVKGNTISGSSGFYAAAEEAAYTVTYQYNGTSQFTYVDKMLIWKTTTRPLPGDLGAVACFGTAPGGATSQAGIVQTGTICISVPVTLAANFDWYAETGT